VTFNPEEYIADEKGFDPEAYVAGSDVEARIVSLGGVKQADGTYLVPGGGTAPFRLSAQGDRLDEAPAIGEESTGEAIGNRVLATAAAGAQGLAPQIAGAARVVATGDTKQYAPTRDSTKATIEQARAKAGIGYDILGSVLSSGLAAPETLLGRVALAGGVSAINAGAASDVDLTKDDASLGDFAKDVATGAGIGIASAGVGEGLGFGIRKLGGLVTGNAAKAIATQTAKDAAAVEKEIASLAGKVGAETQKGSRLIENLQRGTDGLPAIEGAKELAEGVLANNRATLPGQLATIEAAKVAHAAAVAAGPGKAAQMTRDYFAAPLFQSEILPRLKATIAPRFGLAAAGLVMGGAADLLTGGDGRSGGFAGAVLGAPGMMQMLRNVAKSPRVQVAVATKLVPLLQSVANTVAKGVAPTAAMLTQYVLTEELLGPPGLAAEQLIAANGIGSVLGANKPLPGTALNAPQTEVDRAIQQTAAVTLLGGALEAQNEKLAKGLERLFKGKPDEAKPQAMPDLAALQANPQAMLERLANNAGNLPSVAPMIAAELAATAQRATDYLLKVSATPPKKGPLAPEWVRSDAEKRSVRLASDVIASPMSILESAAAGMLVPEQVAALNAVYPMLGRQMADMALDRLTSGEDVPYRARLMVGFLTGVDPDGTFASIGPNQLAIRAQSQKPSNAGVASQAGADKLTVASRTSERQVES
jgi:hypothetical protein